MDLGKGLSAFGTTEALKAVAMLSKLFTFNLAIVASHAPSPFDFSRRRPENDALGFTRGQSPCLNLAPSAVSAADGALSYLSQRTNSTSVAPTKFERSSSIRSDDLALLPKSLKNRIEKRQGISYASEVVSPACEGIPDFDRTHWPTRCLIDDGPHEVGPRDFCLYLLTEGVLKAYFRRLQLSDFCTQLVALARFQIDFCPYFLKGFLEGVCHGNC